MSDEMSEADSVYGAVEAKTKASLQQCIVMTPCIYVDEAA
jgi:hypothetical protein